MKVAIVHDWLYTIGGAERVLKQMLKCYPNADVYTLFDKLSDTERAWIGYKKAHTSFLDRIPRVGKLHRTLLPLMPFAVEQWDFSKYDLVISSSYAVAKGVITGPDQVHISYVHSPMRYIWDLQQQYLKESGGQFGLKSLLTRVIFYKMRLWDTASGSRSDAVLANSAFVARRIKKAFGRTADVIYPPVDVTDWAADEPRGDHFLTAGRLVGYKNSRAIVEAFALLPEQKLIVAGEGPEAALLRAIASPNVTFVGFVTDSELRRLMASARAVVLAAEEDFGILAVEAQAEGTPVICLGRGGACENVIANGPRPTGMYFSSPQSTEIATCINMFITRESDFSKAACRGNALTFSAERFCRQFKEFVDNYFNEKVFEIRASRGIVESPYKIAAE